MSQSITGIACLHCEITMPRQIRDTLEAVGFVCAMLGGLIVLLAIHQPASAQETDESVERVSVSYVPQDMSDPARTRRLLVRIDRAALQACGNMNGLSIPTQEIIERSHCHHEAFNRAVAAFHSPTLMHMVDAIDPWIGPTTQEP